VNDAAYTAQRLLHEAHRRGYAWDFLPLAAPAAPPSHWAGVTGTARKAAVGGAWLGRLAWQARAHDVVHIHSATTLGHARHAVRRYVLHCHGSDVRSRQYDPDAGEMIRTGLATAEAVFYSTPDLAEHILPHRADAVLLPVPIDVTALPRWDPLTTPPRVVFASRWEAVKGLPAQLDTAEQVVRALGRRADVVGLDWGLAAADAAARGIRLVPRLDHTAYLRLLAGAHVVVGQAAGILSASELEALGTGAPLAVPAPLTRYAGSAPPVYGSSPRSVAEVVSALLDGSAAHDPEATRAWVAGHHSPAGGVDLLVATYRRIMGQRA
jgi:hypothetical protein